MKNKIEKKKYTYRKCVHNKAQYYCVPCGGNGICVHNKRKYECKECGGKAYCVHSKYKNRCIHCSDKMCVHSKRKVTCDKCSIKKSKKIKLNKSVIAKETESENIKQNDIKEEIILNKKDGQTVEDLFDIDFSKVFD